MLLMFELIAGAAIAIWIYLAWMVWKKNPQIFNEQIEPKLADRRLKMLKASLLVAVTSLVLFLVSTILPRTGYALVEEEVKPFLFIEIFSIVLLAAATIGGLAIFLKGRQKPTQGNSEVSAV